MILWWSSNKACMILTFAAAPAHCFQHYGESDFSCFFEKLAFGLIFAIISFDDRHPSWRHDTLRCWFNTWAKKWKKETLLMMIITISTEIKFGWSVLGAFKDKTLIWRSTTRAYRGYCRGLLRVPISRIAFTGGPTNKIPSLWHIWANSTFSERNP